MGDLRQREPRKRNPQYLAWLRKMPCSCGCGSPASSDAAHIRAGSIHYGKRNTGKSEKPHDHWAVPLNHDHHMAQHDFGDECLWWSAHGKDPFYLALQYNARYTRETGKDPTVNTVRPKRPSAVAETGHKPRVSKPSRPAKRAQRPRHKAKWAKGRKIVSRGFENGRTKRN